MFPMQPCRFPPGEVPNCTNLREAAGQTLHKGQVVRRTAAGLLEKHPLDVATGVLGVAQGGAAMNETVNVAKADMVTEFLAHVTDGTGAVLKVAAADIGVNMRIVETAAASGYAALPSILTLRAVTGAVGESPALVQITDVKPDLNVAIFKFLPAVMQETAS